MTRINLDHLRTYFRLGLRNLIRVGGYRIGLKTGRHPVLKLSNKIPQGPFFACFATPPEGAYATTAWQQDALYFSHHLMPLDGVPDWHANPFRPGTRSTENLPWFRIDDFNPALGDIKCVWEASRMGWAVAMAQRAALGEEDNLARMNDWLMDWLAKNPPYQGANWKCGQEASIRVMHLILSAVLLGSSPGRSLPGFDAVIALHLERIAPTMSYAIGQANNHGSSEAAALFLGGVWLDGSKHEKAAAWQAQGRRRLEDRAHVLIAPDGTFSQYSTVYHRVMLDTYSLVEALRRRFGGEAFSHTLTNRLSAATDWLESIMLAPKTGEVPNLGSNDGALLIPLSGGDYRDFRPSLQTASLLFRNNRAIKAEGDWDQPALWLDIPCNRPYAIEPISKTLPDGGFHILRSGRAGVLLHYPQFSFRPSHSDLLHVDFWVDGKNLLRDAGTYSYAAENPEFSYFKGVRAHNTIEFDDGDQMTDLGRFLFGAWPNAEQVELVSCSEGAVHAAAGFTDHRGISHHREIQLSDRKLTVCDRFSGHRSRAILRWRLAPGQYTTHTKGISGEGLKISVATDAACPILAITEGAESLYYQQENAVPVLEVDISDATQVTTHVEF